MSFSTINWLKSNAGPFQRSQKGYYSKQGSRTSTGFYYTHPLDGKELANKLAELKEIKKQQLAVTETDKATGQNPLHFILSNKIFEFESNQANEKTLLQASLSKVKFNSFDDYVFGYKTLAGMCTCNSCRGGLHYDVHQYMSNLFLAGKSLEGHKHECYQNYDDLKHEIKTVRERVEEQTKLMIECLFSPFQKESKELTEKLFLIKDKNGKSPLHYSFDFETTLAPVLNAIKYSAQESKIQILRDRGPKGENYLHMVAKKCGSFHEIREAFGSVACLNALAMDDDDNNTPLHSICALNKQKMMSEVAELLTASENKESKSADEFKPVSAESLFRKNRKGKNPLHLACLGNSDDNAVIIELLSKILNKQFITKAKEQDNEGNTALHHAVQSNNVQKVLALLANLSFEHKKSLAVIKNNNKDTVLHFACRSNNREILKLVLDALGSAEIYRLRLESSEIDSFLKQKENFMLLKEYNSLFDGFQYLKEHFSQKVNYQLREEDFKNILDSLEHSQPFPEINPKFFAKTHLTLMGHEFKGSEEYLKCRKYFSETTKREFEEFKTFLLQAKDSKDQRTSKLAKNLLGIDKFTHLAEVEPSEKEQELREYKAN